VQVTVLFCDIVGSTRLGEALDPEALRAVQARYFAVCSEALLRHGGEVEKFIGDAVMCVFGLPRAHEDDAMRGCRAALDLVAAVKRLSDELGVEIGQRLAVRVGVHTGEAVAGDSSGGQALVTGDAVNTAARLEQAAGTGEILLGEPTYQLVAGAVQADRVEAVPAQGKAQPVPAYRLRGLSLVRRAVGEQSPLVGRDGELAELRGTLERVIDHRRAELVVLVGEAGIGKSRLVAELVAALPPGGRALTGQCASYGEGVRTSVRSRRFWRARPALSNVFSERSGGGMAP
jgi:class 3 adenylate cyclase